MMPTTTRLLLGGLVAVALAALLVVMPCPWNCFVCPNNCHVDGANAK